MPTGGAGMIHRHEYDKSPALAAELQSISKIYRDSFDSYAQANLQDFVREFLQTNLGLEFADAVQALVPNSVVLDIGVGMGQTSLHLATLGHRVTAIEPSWECCRVAEAVASKNGLAIDVHECTIEAFQSDRRFDVCIFNASFHHCDDPTAALRRCHDLLKDTGTVMLVNEQVLKFYRSKRWYYRMLRTNPEKVDHYGGNEHNYRLPEYVRMVKAAGFRNVTEKIPAYYQDFRAVALNAIRLKASAERHKYSESQLAARFAWYFLLSRATRNKLLTGIAKRLSLITCTVIGRKQ
jgi:2-polyprenyl-3-methyl-5-hydroxy-6-metoxy-1,4-benzoquinol methylase